MPDPFPGRWGSTLFVDELRRRRRDGEWTQVKSCHLFTFPGWEDDLHEFASKLGLQRMWYQTAAILPHYDLTPVRRLRAVALGAVELDRGDLINAIRLWRGETRRLSDRALHLQGQEDRASLKNVPEDERADHNHFLTPREFIDGLEEIRSQLS